MLRLLCAGLQVRCLNPPNPKRLAIRKLAESAQVGNVPSCCCTGQLSSGEGKRLPTGLASRCTCCRFATTDALVCSAGSRRRAAVQAALCLRGATRAVLAAIRCRFLSARQVHLQCCGDCLPSSTSNPEERSRSGQSARGLPCDHAGADDAARLAGRGHHHAGPRAAHAVPRRGHPRRLPRPDRLFGSGTAGPSLGAPLRLDSMCLAASEPSAFARIIWWVVVLPLKSSSAIKFSSEDGCTIRSRAPALAAGLIPWLASAAARAIAAALEGGHWSAVSAEAMRRAERSPVSLQAVQAVAALEAVISEPRQARPMSPSQAAVCVTLLPML